MIEAFEKIENLVRFCNTTTACRCLYEKGESLEPQSNQVGTKAEGNMPLG